MTELTKDMENWLQQQVRAGRFEDIADAVRNIVNHYQKTVIEAEKAAMWVKPLLDEAIKSLDEGKGKPAATVHARLRQGLDL